MDITGNIGFIGGGNMAEALLKGLIEKQVPPANLKVSEPVAERRQFLEQRYGLAVTADNLEVVNSCELLVLAVKPQIVGTVLPAFASAFSHTKLLVSILAGVSTSVLEGFFTGSPRIVRAMPNTPALVGCAATAICPGRYVQDNDLTIAQALFEAVGVVRVVSEYQMDAVTGLSGSGPAYVFTIIEALADGGVQEGLPKDVALVLAVQTVLGAARMVGEGGEHPAVLRDRVCSPGGTTIAAVKALESGCLRATLMEAVSRAAARSRELGKK